MEYEILTVMGPTASGKTGMAVALAKALGGEIISGDSRQVYRGMDLGTGKDLAEYDGIPHHLIDIAPAGSKYNLHQYLKDFHIAFNDIRSRGCLPVLCGGSGLYVESAISGVVLPDVPADAALRESLAGKSLAELTDILRQSKQLHNTTDIDTPQRAIRAIEIRKYYEAHPGEALLADREAARPLRSFNIVLDISREARRERISRRLRSRLDEGMVDEIRRLLDSGIKPDDLIYYGLEYRFLTLYVTGQLDYDEMLRRLEIAIHQFAKRQMTWLRGMERRGFTLHYVPYDSDPAVLAESLRPLF